jgi:hypothetical protein
VAIAIQVAAEPSSAPSAPIVWVGHGDRENIVLSRVHDDLAARFKVRGSRWRLVSPTFLLPGAFGSHEARRVRATIAGHLLSLTADAPNASLRRSMAIAPTLGWALLVPSSLRIGPRYYWYSLLWMTVFLFPLGYWAGSGLVARGGIGRVDAAPAAIAAASIAVAFAALGLVAAVMTDTRPLWWEWAGASGAMLAGGATAVVVRRLARSSDALGGVLDRTGSVARVQVGHA